MIRYEFRKPEGDTVQSLIELSRLWVEEDCCWGMVENGIDDLSEPLVVALDEEKIVGYAFGHFETLEKHRSYASKGENCFLLDELYVLPEYRGQGIGKNLFHKMEELVKIQCDCICLTTSTKNYQAILKLYIEELGMSFSSAFLFKRTQEETT